MQVVTLSDVPLEEGPGREGFWFRAAELGPLVGASTIGAGLYEAREGVPIWPYHYHYPDEEWLYVLDGAPVLRDSGPARRTLRAGDLVCFPPGHRGAHTLDGPGRFIIFSRGRDEGPYTSVYPDSDKVSVVAGDEPDGINQLMLGRAGSVDYWHGEVSGPVAAAEIIREPPGVPGPPVLAVPGLALEAGDACRSAPLGEALGADRLDGAVLTLPPGADDGPYRYEHGRELWLLVLAGTPVACHRHGERPLSPGELACFPDGQDGGRCLVNPGTDPARALLLWTTGHPVASCYPDLREWVLHPAPGAEPIPLRPR